jgi:hypothetical protein
LCPYTECTVNICLPDPYSQRVKIRSFTNLGRGWSELQLPVLQNFLFYLQVGNGFLNLKKPKKPINFF